jgi:hypothetical protein
MNEVGHVLVTCLFVSYCYCVFLYIFLFVSFCLCWFVCLFVCSLFVCLLDCFLVWMYECMFVFSLYLNCPFQIYFCNYIFRFHLKKNISICCLPSLNICIFIYILILIFVDQRLWFLIFPNYILSFPVNKMSIFVPADTFSILWPMISF